MRQRHIIQQDVEPRCPLYQVLPHKPTDALPLGDQLTSIELCNNRLEDLVDDGWKDTLVVVCAESSEDRGKGVNLGAGEDTAGDVDHLEI